MNKIIIVIVASCLVLSCSAAASASVSTACPTLLLGCKDVTAANCLAYSTDGTNGNAKAGRHCITIATGFYSPVTTAALADATATTDDQLCSLSCASSTSCKAPVAGTNPTATTSTTPTTLNGFLCNACAYNYGPVSTALPSVTNSAYVNCGACTATNCGNASTYTCYTDNTTYAGQCLSCSGGYYPVANTSAGTLSGTGAATQIVWTDNKGPTSCVACNATMTGCTGCTNNSVCLSCSSSTTLKNGKCTSFGAKLVSGLAFIAVGVMSTLLF